MVTKLTPGEFFGQPRQRCGFGGLRFIETAYSGGMVIPKHEHAEGYFSFAIAGFHRQHLSQRTREVSPWTPPPGMHPDYYRVIPLGPRIAGVFLVIATILAHGALLTSIGLALAVWIKRPSRAIASSVGLFILIAAAWPILASIAMSRVTGGADQSTRMVGQKAPLGCDSGRTHSVSVSRGSAGEHRGGVSAALIACSRRHGCMGLTTKSLTPRLSD